MANDEKQGEPRATRPRRGAGYTSARRPKLLGLSISLIEPRPAVPPPLPGGNDGLGRFGEAAEDGLRMLAALEALPSLEPDFGEDLAAEASVAIIERAAVEGHGEDRSDEEASYGSLRARLGDMDAPFDIVADEYAAYQGPVEEASVEIVEIDAGPPAEPDAPSSPRKDMPVAASLLKALAARSD